jgi:hypothetical protein
MGNRYFHSISLGLEDQLTVELLDGRALVVHIADLQEQTTEDVPDHAYSILLTLYSKDVLTDGVTVSGGWEYPDAVDPLTCSGTSLDPLLGGEDQALSLELSIDVLRPGPIREADRWPDDDD